ncbi:hypothetical protein HYN04_09935 [Phenylobacterium parvum]|uniref:Uncharacterized protein n=1 Tax=Phenylobacterium parvum TaxID=2201350 RepID=A0A2Z3I3H7_9CAUL|nr:hypothetical protein HYN04_09935 [Phenylobacterium parvum]
MPQKETPRTRARGRTDLAIGVRALSNPATRQAQILRCRYGVRPILAGVLAALIFGEAADHG